MLPAYKQGFDESFIHENSSDFFVCEARRLTCFDPEFILRVFEDRYELLLSSPWRNVYALKRTYDGKKA